MVFRNAGLQCLAVIFSIVTARAAEPTGGPSSAGQFQRCHLVSRLDGADVEYALWSPPGYDPARRWPAIVFLHGSAEGGSWSAPTAEAASIPVRGAKADLPFVVIYPLMRGTWSISGLAELDVLETIDDACGRVSIDPDRIHLTGISLGGFAGWRIACRYPDRFASVSLFCGGGEPELAGNLRNLPVRVYHGTADKNVNIRESRRMVESLRAAGIEPAYTELVDVGHTCWLGPYSGAELYEWMARQVRVADPRRVSYQTESLRHHRAYWVSIDSVLDPEQAASVDAFVPEAGQILIHAENVGRLTLSPPASLVPPETKPDFFVNNQPVQGRRVDGGWVVDLAGDEGPSPQKRPGLSGPVQDVFYDPFVVVVPAASSKHAPVWREAAGRALGWTERLVFKNVRVVSSDSVTPELVQNANLICFGDPQNDPWMREVAESLPVTWSGGRLRVGGEPGPENVAALVMIYPNPKNPDRYVVMCSGEPSTAVALAAGVLQPPFLSRAPQEDLVVVTMDKEFPLATVPPVDPDRWRSMADPVPSRGAVFDRNWQLRSEARVRLLGAAAPAGQTDSRE